MEAATEIPPRRGFDWTLSVMVVVTAGCFVGAAWLRFQRSRTSALPAVGAPVPPLTVLDLETSEPLVLLGLKGRVVWIVFWSADAASGRTALVELERVWHRLGAHPRFTVVAAAIDVDHPERVQAAAADAGLEFPVYLSGAETRRRFGVERADPPVHLLVGVDGKVTAIARGEGRPTIERIADQAKRELDQLEPANQTRFASAWDRATGGDG
jgi:hypothetical protein